jgi:hypothetical protein
MPLLTFSAYNQNNNFGDVSQVDQAALTNQAQDSDLLFHCLADSINPADHAKVANEAVRRTFIMYFGCHHQLHHQQHKYHLLEFIGSK